MRIISVKYLVSLMLLVWFLTVSMAAVLDNFEKKVKENSVLLNIGTIKVAAAHDLFLDVELMEQPNVKIKEVGIVYGTLAKPTLRTNKIARNKVETKFKQRITNLKPETLYYIRPYAITSKGVQYGEQLSMSTIKKGNFTYSFIPNEADEETIKRIKTAFDKATAYYNNFTSIVKHVTVNYSPGTPTADGNFNGWINMGAKESYQQTGTAMHELAHTVGVGQHWKYNELMKNTWQGKRANEILQMMTNNPNAVVNGDGMHFWPYGINGSWEDTASEELYMIHALILQGMKADGLPSN